MAELGRLDDIVNYATSKGLKIEIEPHNYGYGFGALIGSAQTPNSSFADLWGKLAVHYKSNPDVIFGLMNEPHVQSATVWLSSANAAIAAIRSAGAVQEILVPGSYWDGAWTWTTSDNAAVIGTGIEVRSTIWRSKSTGISIRMVAVRIRASSHHYWHRTGDRSHAMGGNDRKSFVPGRSRRQHGSSELDCVGQDAELHPAAHQCLGRRDLLGGWSVVGNYMFSIEPEGGVDKPQMTILVEHLTPAPTSLTPSSAEIYIPFKTLTMGLFDLVSH